MLSSTDCYRTQTIPNTFEMYVRPKADDADRCDTSFWILLFVLYRALINSTYVLFWSQLMLHASVHTASHLVGWSCINRVK